eukprot:gene5318-3820_t
MSSKLFSRILFCAVRSRGQALTVQRAQIGAPSAFVAARFFSHNVRAFSSEDEAQLSEVMVSNPKDVVTFIRKSMQKSRRRSIHFRNCVTSATIILQSRLHAKAISIADASAVVECLLKECAVLRQADMAHLLVRASLRFGKFGNIVRASFVKHLHLSYRGIHGGSEVLTSIGQELCSNPEYTFLAALALLLGGDPAEIERINPLELSCSEVEILVECYALMNKYEEILRLLTLVASPRSGTTSTPRQLAFTRENIDMFFSAAVSASTSGEHIQRMIDLGIEHRVVFSDKAAALALSHRLMSVNTYDEVMREEKLLMEQLRLDGPIPIVRSVIISKYAEIVLRSSQAQNTTYLSSVVDALVEEAHHVSDESAMNSACVPVAIVKGYGALGQHQKMKELLTDFQKSAFPHSYRVFEEALRWYSFARNVKEAIYVKEMMNELGIYHTVHTYQYLFRCLDTSFPQEVEKYYREMRARGIRLDGYIIPILLRAFGETRKESQIEAIYSEAKSNALSGVPNSVSAKVVVFMLRFYQTNLERCKSLINDAEKMGLLSEETVQAEYINVLTTNHCKEELDRFLSNVSLSSPHVARALLRNAAKRKERSEFDAVLARIEEKVGLWDEQLALTVITAYSHFNDIDNVRKYVAFSKKNGLIRTSLFYAEVAAAYSRSGATAEIDACWDSVVSSPMSHTIQVYNKFLDLYLHHNNIGKVQEVLDTMIRLTPPNAATVTTVIDVLGKMGRLDEMESVLESMSTSSNAVPTLHTLHTVMTAYAKVGNVAKMEEIRSRVSRDGFVEGSQTYNLLFEGYGKAKRFERIHELLQECHLKNIEIDEAGYLLLLQIFSREKRAKDTEQIVNRLISSGLPLSNKLLAHIAAAFASVSDISEMQRYVNLLLEHPGCSTRDLEMVYSIYAKLRDTGKIQELLDNPAFGKTRNIYNTCVAAFAKAGEYMKVAYLLSEMERQHFSLEKPTSILLSSLLVKAGKTDLAQAVLNSQGTEEGFECEASDTDKK